MILLEYFIVAPASRKRREPAQQSRQASPSGVRCRPDLITVSVEFAMPRRGALLPSAGGVA